MHLEIRPVSGLPNVKIIAALDKQIFPKDAFSVDNFLQNPDFRYFIVFINRKAIGSVVLEHHKNFQSREQGTLYLSSIGILPSYRRFGLGMTLMSWLAVYARINGFKKLASLCRISNKASRELHRKLGYRVVVRITEYYENPRETALLLERNLYR